MKKMVVAGMIGLTVGFAQAAEWRPVASSVEDVWFLDSSSLVSVSGSRVGWVRIVKKSEATTTGGVRYSITKYASHCKSRGLQILSWADYLVDGKVNQSSSRPYKTEDVYPDSIGESLFGYMCGATSKLTAIKAAGDTFQYTDQYFSVQGQ